MSRFAFEIDIPIRSDWSNIDLLLTSVKYCFAAMLADVDGCQTMAMVTGELLENAVKYGDWSGKERAFRFRVSGEGNRATVIVENPVRDPAGAVQEIDATLRWIRTFPSPEEAYRARLLEVAASDGERSSKLGLVRVAYQAACTLRVERAGGGVRVVADVSL